MTINPLKEKGMPLEKKLASNCSKTLQETRS